MVKDDEERGRWAKDFKVHAEARGAAERFTNRNEVNGRRGLRGGTGLERRGTRGGETVVNGGRWLDGFAREGCSFRGSASLGRSGGGRERFREGHGGIVG